MRTATPALFLGAFLLFLVQPLVAKAVHCSPVPDASAFLSGWEFMRGSAEKTEAAIGRLLQTVE